MSGEIDIVGFYTLIQKVYDMVMLHEIEKSPGGLMKNLTFHEVHTIENIGDHPGATMSDLARFSDITTSTMTTMINKLVKRGFVKRRREDSDRRIVMVTLTKKGEKAYAEHRELHNNVGRKMLALMDEEEKRVIYNLYEKISKLADGEEI